ncbi:hypothetical protein EXIGLDRAFT_715946 [Exidia glandulosa HHB12029]|uniref:Glycoside hydrolase family 125 protein n=1 Tax=Exidia glandulosa HHB12029 TaxID=1314781 RepID=A0A165QPZ1_EXIGL|nr:hypothetical protein EXIGLDRAFT_715946 [Exidia glandulosa HHB12029]
MLGPAVAVLAAAASVRAASCPDYSSFSMSPQGNASLGPLGLPFMRPAEECRTFKSPAVEQVIADMKAKLKNPDLARLFENTFPNTLDTTVKYFNKEQNLAFIITGDITAQWLRDTANQFAHYQALLPKDPELKALVKAVINNEARYIKQYPYCGAFQPPPESGLSPTHNDWNDGVTINPPINTNIVFECKYELDSLCGFLKLSRAYFQNTNDSSFINDDWNAAVKQIFKVIEEQSQPTFDEDFNLLSYYSWSGGNGALSPMVNNHGNNEPNAYTGMVKTHHRPSDDLATFAFLTPANAMLSVELKHLADVFNKAKVQEDVADNARALSKRISDAVWKHTVVDNIFAYETNGFGGRYVMDDANVPSLLSLPYLGFLDKKHPAYVATRKLLLSRGNPYYSRGKQFFGVGGPHVDAWDPWPMSLISSIYGTDNDKEITDMLETILNNTAGLGLIHESVNIYNNHQYTRSWFAWANSYFAEMVLDLAERKPHLILKDSKPYRLQD